MAREKGTFQVSANYEPLKAAPFDARALVETKADLVSATTWIADGELWIYSGMIVSVGMDPVKENNGIYFLRDVSQFQSFELGWIKLADLEALLDLQEQLNNISTQISFDISLETKAELPIIGNSNYTYYIRDNAEILKWDTEIGDYISYGNSSFEDIEIIDGGSAND